MPTYPLLTLALVHACFVVVAVARTSSRGRSTSMLPAGKMAGPDGIQMLYPTANDDLSWYSAASWSPNRSIVQTGGATVDPFDSRSVLHGAGSARIVNGLMTTTGTPARST